jgi:hypothetical protein
MIDVRLQQVMDSTREFGGIAMLFVGDFNQLGPVKDTFLLADMMKWAVYESHRDNNLFRESLSSARVPQMSTTSVRVPHISTMATPPPVTTRTLHTNVPKKVSIKRMSKIQKKKAAKKAK